MQEIVKNRFYLFQAAFYLLVLITYIERQIHFDFYFSFELVEEFGSDLLGSMTSKNYYSTVHPALKYLHLIFLLISACAIFNKKNVFGNIFLYSFNLLLLYLNYSPGFSVDIFIQIGLFFYLFCHPGKGPVAENKYALFSIQALRCYLAFGYIFSSYHKFIDVFYYGPRFIDTIVDIQGKMDVADIFLIDYGENAEWIFAFGIILLQLVGGLCLLIRPAWKIGIYSLILFHVSSSLILNLYLFPLVAIILILTSTQDLSKGFWSLSKEIVKREPIQQ